MADVSEIQWKFSYNEDTEKEVFDSIDSALNEIAAIIVGVIQSIIEVEAFDIGTLHRSVFADITKYLEKYVIINAPHAKAVNEGVEPGHMPPYQPIFEWVGRKLMDVVRSIALEREITIKKAQKLLTNQIRYSIYRRGREGIGFYEKGCQAGIDVGPMVFAEHLRGCGVHLESD